MWICVYILRNLSGIKRYFPLIYQNCILIDVSLYSFLKKIKPSLEFIVPWPMFLDIQTMVFSKIWSESEFLTKTALGDVFVHFYC